MKVEGDFFLVGGSPPTAPCMVLCKGLRFDCLMQFFTFAVGSFGFARAPFACPLYSIHAVPPDLRCQGI